MNVELTDLEGLRHTIDVLISEVRLLREARTGGAGFEATEERSSNDAIDESEILAQSVVTPNVYNDEDATLADIRLNISKSQSELDQIVCELAERDVEKREMEKSVSQMQILIKELEERRRNLEGGLEALESQRRDCEILRQEASELTPRVQGMRGELDRLEGYRLELAQREQEALRGIEEGRHANQLLGRLWPEWLMSPGLRQWKERLEHDVFNPDAPPSFGLHFAAIHTYNAALRDPDARFLLDALRELGRRLYQWLKDLEIEEMTVAEHVETWAAAINAECDGRLSLQVASPGTQANNKWMVFAPRGGSSPDVLSVRSWCVVDQQGRPIHRAEVFV